MTLSPDSIMAIAATLTFTGTMIFSWLKFSTLITKLSVRLESLERALANSERRINRVESDLTQSISKLGDSSVKVLVEIERIRANLEDFQRTTSALLANYSNKFDIYDNRILDFYKSYELHPKK